MRAPKSLVTTKSRPTFTGLTNQAPEHWKRAMSTVHSPWQSNTSCMVEQLFTDFFFLLAQKYILKTSCVGGSGHIAVPSCNQNQPEITQNLANQDQFGMSLLSFVSTNSEVYHDKFPAVTAQLGHAPAIYSCTAMSVTRKSFMRILE